MEDARMPPYADNPALWRQRAQEARIQAEQMGDAETREQMLTSPEITTGWRSSG
jgi:hypothetical protein